MEPGAIACAEVSFLLVIVDSFFPRSQPRVHAPEARRDFSWPHVEPNGVLCLRDTMLTADPGQRVVDHLSWALELLQFSEAKPRAEFAREFSTYWTRCASEKRALPVLSLLKPGGPSRDVVWFADMRRLRVIAAEDRTTLMRWLRNSGANPSDQQVVPGRLVWLRRPWIPAEFPKHGREVLAHLSADDQQHVLHPGKLSLVMFGSKTPTGIAFAATILEGPAKKDLTKGFRGLSTVPPGVIARSYAGRPVIRCPVSRIDGAWIHGRDLNDQYQALAQRKIAVVGCGALGAAIARLLAQAGVGTYLLVDGDDIAGHNTSRHVLGQRFIGKNKAAATAQMLKEDFPHIHGAEAFPLRFEALRADELRKLAACDIVISAGIDIDGDAALDHWRAGLSQPPAHICTWVEPFALVGHAAALLGGARLMDAFDELERVRFRLTDWPVGCGALAVEAGCGNVFQPHGAVELQATVGVAAGVALDVLSGKVAQSMRRVWQGDPDDVGRKGGAVSHLFTEKMSVREHVWL